MIPPITNQLQKESGLTSEGTWLSGVEAATNKAHVRRRESNRLDKRYIPVVFSVKTCREDDGSLSCGNDEGNGSAGGMNGGRKDIWETHASRAGDLASGRMTIIPF